MRKTSNMGSGPFKIYMCRQSVAEHKTSFISTSGALVVITVIRGMTHRSVCPIRPTKLQKAPKSHHVLQIPFNQWVTGGLTVLGVVRISPEVGSFFSQTSVANIKPLTHPKWNIIVRFTCSLSSSGGKAQDRRNQLCCDSHSAAVVALLFTVCSCVPTVKFYWRWHHNDWE